MNVSLKTAAPESPIDALQAVSTPAATIEARKPVAAVNRSRLDRTIEPPPETPDMHFRVALDIFRGPLDLLLYLVRKHELDIVEVSIAKITEQFLEHMEVLEQLDVNMVGDFIEMASVLIEIKAKMVLPQVEEKEEQPLDDPHEDLVHQLLEYKKYKDASKILEDRGRGWQQRYSRLANDLPPREISPVDQPIHEVELWDLVSAFGRVIRAHEKSKPCSVVYDETPISVFMERIHARLHSDGQIAFSDMFEPGMHKANLIGVFLAVLELVRHHKVDAEQTNPHGEIYLIAGEEFTENLRLEIGEVDNYSNSNTQESESSADAAAKPR